MKHSRYLKPLLIFVLMVNTSAFAQKTKLLLLPTIHTLHKSNSNYSFAHVMKIVENYKPDIIAVEIRPEDMDQDTSYLKTFYQPEMIMVKNSFPGIKKAGIDYFGTDMQGKHLTADFLKDTTVEMGVFRVLGRKMGRDTAISKASLQQGLPALKAKQNQMMAKSSAAQLLDGTYDAITNEYSSKLAALLANTKYEEYAQFSARRDQKLSDNIQNLVIANPGKRIIVLSGANHHNRYVINLSKLKNVELITSVTDH